MPDDLTAKIGDETMTAVGMADSMVSKVSDRPFLANVTSPNATVKGIMRRAFLAVIRSDSLRIRTMVRNFLVVIDARP